MIVLDASVVVELLLRLPSTEKIEKRIEEELHQLHAPELLDVEVVQVIRRLSLTKSITEYRAETALIDLVEMPLERYSHLPLVNRIWELRKNVSAYDAAYVALAEVLNCSLLTLDKRLAPATGLHSIVELV